MKTCNTSLLAFEKNYRLLIVGILVMMPGFVIIVLAQIMHSFGVLALIIGPSIVMID